MSRGASRDQEQNRVNTSLRLIGGTDCVINNMARNPDLDVDGGARIRKSLCVLGDTILQGDISVDGNLTILGNTTLGGLVFDDIIVDTIDANSGVFDTLSTDTLMANNFMASTFTGDLVGNICSDTVIKGDAVVQGNLQVQGNLTMIDTENIAVQDNKILLNSGEVGAGVTAGTSGIEIDRGTLDNYVVCFDESKPGLVVGTVGNTQCVALIEDTSVNGELLLFNTSTNQIESSGITAIGNGMVGNVCGNVKTQNISPVSAIEPILIDSNVQIAGTLEVQTSVTTSVFTGDNLNLTQDAIIGNSLTVANKITVKDMCVNGNIDSQRILADQVCANIIKTSGNVLFESNVDMNCGEIGNIRVLRVEEISPKVIGGNIEITGNVTGNNNIVAGVEDLFTICELVEDWVQLGQDINGNINCELLGWDVSLSDDGRTLALSSLGDTIVIGYVEIYDFDEMTMLWNQRGQRILGNIADDNFGISISLASNGNTVAIGGQVTNSVIDPGRVQIFDYNGTSMMWEQRGQNIDGDTPIDSSNIVSISNEGNTVAIGGRINDTNGTNSGHVRIFDWNGGSGMWEQRGLAILGLQEFELCGVVSMTRDGNTVAVGSPFHGDPVDSFDQGLTRIFDWNSGSGMWEQRGQNIIGEANNDRSAQALSISDDGNTVAITAPFNDANGVNSGQVRVYDYNSGTMMWEQRGQDLDSSAGAGGIMDVSLSSDGDTVAVGWAVNDDNGMDRGVVIIYDWNETNMMWESRGMNIIGQSVMDRSGQSVSLSVDGSIVAIGSPSNSAGNFQAGQVRVFGFQMCPAEGIDMLCANISNLNSIYVDTLLSKDGVSDISVNVGLSLNNTLSVSGTTTTNNISALSATVTNNLVVGGNISGGNLGLTILDEGSLINSNLETRIINITGSGVTTTSTGNNSVEINIASGIEITDGNLDVQCANISNAESISVDSISSKSAGNVTLTGNLVVTDTLFVGTIAGNSPVTFADPIIAENIQSAVLYEETRDAIVSMLLMDSQGGFSTCSGFFITDDGWVATAAHCVLDIDGSGNTLDISTKRDSANIWVTVTNKNGTGMDEVIHPGNVWVDASGDVAVLKLPGITSQSHLQWGDSGNTMIGTECYALGNPLGSDHQSITKGVVRDNEWVDVDGAQSVESVMTDCDIHGGNSGGPIVNSQAQVIGMMTFGFSTPGIPGLPSILNGGMTQDLAQHVIERLMTDEVDFNDPVLGKGWLGLDTWNVMSGAQLGTLGLEASLPPVGILVGTLAPGGPMALAGFSGGEIIVSIDGVLLGDMEGQKGLSSVTWRKTPGDTVTLDVVSGFGFPPTTTPAVVTLGAFPASEDVPLLGALRNPQSGARLLKPVSFKKVDRNIKLWNR